MLAPSLDTLRLFLHLLAASVWVGGQFVVAGIVPGTRKIGPEATQAVARGFARVAWPAFLLVVVTGMWGLFTVGDDVSASYHVTLGIKVLLVMIAGGAAFLHQTTDKTPVKAATGALGGVLALVVLFLGVLLTTG